MSATTNDLYTSIDWDAVTDETVRHLQELIRKRTVNPPGNEIEAAEYLADLLADEGLEPVVIESAPRRGNVIVRLQGNGEAPPILLFSHLDVVPVEPEQWTRDPFGGDVADGMVWGRGAIDMKGIVAMQLMTVLLLHRLGVPLRRDVIFAATADEEVGGELGMGYLVEHHPDLIRADVALTEFGGFNVEVAGQTFYLVQAGEKGICQFRVRARGTPGHGSLPHDDNAVVKLSDAVTRLGRASLPYKRTPVAEAFVQGLARHMGGVPGLIMRLLAVPAVAPTLIRRLPMPAGTRRTLYAMFHNTVTPTMLQAGEKVNVIPSQAEALVDARILPGDDQERLFAQVREVIGDGYELEVHAYSPPVEQPLDHPMWRIMAETLERHAPGAHVIPYILSGSTDAKHVHRLGITCYGFSPMYLPPGLNFETLAHGHDERIPISALRFGVPVLFEVVHKYAASLPPPLSGPCQ